MANGNAKNWLALIGVGSILIVLQIIFNAGGFFRAGNLDAQDLKDFKAKYETHVEKSDIRHHANEQIDAKQETEIAVIKTELTNLSKKVQEQTNAIEKNNKLLLEFLKNNKQ